jgi:hypothetical protein
MTDITPARLRELADSVRHIGEDEEEVALARRTAAALRAAADQIAAALEGQDNG